MPANRSISEIAQGDETPVRRPTWFKHPRDPNKPAVIVPVAPFSPPLEVADIIVRYALQDMYLGSYTMAPILASVSKAYESLVREAILGAPIRVLGKELVSFGLLLDMRDTDPISDADEIALYPESYLHCANEEEKIKCARRRRMLRSMLSGGRSSNTDLRHWSLLASPMPHIAFLMPADFDTRVLSVARRQTEIMSDVLRDLLCSCTDRLIGTGMGDTQRLLFELESPAAAIRQRVALALDGRANDTREGSRTVTCITGGVSQGALGRILRSGVHVIRQEAFAIHLTEAQIALGTIPNGPDSYPIGIPTPFRRLTISFPTMSQAPPAMNQGTTNPVMEGRANYLRSLLAWIRSVAVGDIVVDIVGIYAWWAEAREDVQGDQAEKTVPTSSQGQSDNAQTRRPGPFVIDRGSRVKEFMRKKKDLSFVTSDHKTLDASVSALTVPLVPSVGNHYPQPLTPPQVYCYFRPMRTHTACYRCHTKLSSHDLTAPLAIASNGDEAEYGNDDEKGCSIWKWDRP